PRFMCYDSSLRLTRAAIAAGMAEGFLPAPRPQTPRSVTDLITTSDGSELPFLDAVREQRERLARPVPLIHRIGEQQRVRRAKIDQLLAEGQQPYPATVPRSCAIAEVRARHAGLVADTATGAHVSIAGRVRAIR